MSNMTKKRAGILVGVVAVVVVGVVFVTTSLSSAMTLNEAKDAAKKYVPATVEFVSSEQEDNSYEVYFYDSKNKVSYEADVSTETKRVKKVESQMDNDLGSKTVKLSETEVKNIVKKAFDGIKSINVILTSDDGLYEYEATFKSNEFYGDATVNPENGKLLETTVKYGTPVKISNEKKTEGNNFISSEEAKKAVLKEVPGGTVTDLDFEKSKNYPHYEIEVYKDGVEYDYTVDAKTGKATLKNEHDSYFDYDDDDEYGYEYEVVEKPKADTTKSSNSENTTTQSNKDNVSSSSNTSNQISESKASSIVKDKIPGATIRYIHLERDDGMYVYSGEAVSSDGIYEYDFEIDASSGAIVEWDKEKVENDDYDD